MKRFKSGRGDVGARRIPTSVVVVATVVLYFLLKESFSWWAAGLIAMTGSLATWFLMEMVLDYPEVHRQARTEVARRKSENEQ